MFKIVWISRRGREHTTTYRNIWDAIQNGFRSHARARLIRVSDGVELAQTGHLKFLLSEQGTKETGLSLELYERFDYNDQHNYDFGEE